MKWCHSVKGCKSYNKKAYIVLNIIQSSLSMTNFGTIIAVQDVEARKGLTAELLVLIMPLQIGSDFISEI